MGTSEEIVRSMSRTQTVLYVTNCWENIYWAIQQTNLHNCHKFNQIRMRKSLIRVWIVVITFEFGSDLLVGRFVTKTNGSV